MKILYLANNKLGWKIGQWLKNNTEDEIVGLVLHSESKRKYGAEILNTFNLSDDVIFDGSKLREDETRQAISQLRADIALSIFFGYILKPNFIALFPEGVINLHPSYLPYNRGSYPNVWSIIEETPAGATLHYIDAGIDTGSIIAQKQVEVEPIDTGGTLYSKLEQASYDVFIESWAAIRKEKNPRIKQPLKEGTSHRIKDVQSIDPINLDATYTARQLLNILRARTFPPHRGAYFIAEDGRRVNIRVELEYDDED